MNLKSFYESINGDYEGTMKRFASEYDLEREIIDFVDNNGFVSLIIAMESESHNEVFMAVHSLAGKCVTLGFSDMVSALTDMMSGVNEGVSADAQNSFERVEREYTKVVNGIKDLEFANNF